MGRFGREAKRWFAIDNLGSNAADLWVYDEIGAWGVTAEGLVRELATLNVGEITVHISSPGGDVFDGIAIMNALRDHPANVTVKVDALAASIASVIAQAGNKVIMGRNSMMMIHNASGFAMGEAADMLKMAALLTQTTENIASIYAERAGGTVKQWLAVMADETWYTAAEAVAAGLADEVAPLPTEKEAGRAAARFDLSVYNHAPALPAVVEEDPPAPAPVVVPVEPVAPAPAPGPPIPTASLADTLRAAVATAAAPPVVPVWDPDLFRAAVGVVAAHVPTGPPPVRAVTLPDLITPDPAPVEAPVWDGAAIMRAAVGIVTTTVPAPEAPPPTPPPAGGFDPTVFDLAIREARK